MLPPDPDTTSRSASPEQFASTHWSVVLAAAQSASPHAQEAMERLCAAYWYPLYAFLRRQGLDEQAAKDATQEFFAQRIVTKKIFQGMEAGEGKFRSWLLASLRNLLANESDWQNARKRGGGVSHVPLDFDTAEGRYRIEPADSSTPEKLYEQAWAFTLLSQVRERLRERYAQEEKAELFSELKSFLPGEQSGRLRAEVAARLGQNENALNVAIHRLRQEFGKMLRAEIRRTVSRSEEVDEEIRHLIQVVSQ